VLGTLRVKIILIWALKRSQWHSLVCLDQQYQLMWAIPSNGIHKKEMETDLSKCEYQQMRILFDVINCGCKNSTTDTRKKEENGPFNNFNVAMTFLLQVDLIRIPTLTL
jgi:hypothetical protein